MNKESTWKECIGSSSSIQISPDKAKAKSLLDTALGRNHFLRKNEITAENANYILEGYYSSALEILHAFLLLHGYKVLNHICAGYFLRDVVKREDLFRLFDDCRFKRNSLIYYGKKMDFETAKVTIKKCRKLIKELRALLEKG
jgi:uncharacterized protein (UPF0332 family)